MIGLGGELGGRYGNHSCCDVRDRAGVNAKLSDASFFSLSRLDPDTRRIPGTSRASRRLVASLLNFTVAFAVARHRRGRRRI